MGVYLCLGQPIWQANKAEALDFSQFANLQEMNIYFENNEKVLILLGKGLHKSKESRTNCSENFINYLSKNN